MNSVLKDPKIDKALTHIIDSNLAWTYRIIPFLEEKEKLTFYTDSDSLEANKLDLKIILDKEIDLILTDDAYIQKSLIQFYRNPTLRRNDNSHESNFLNTVIDEAIDSKSSDIHFEVLEKDVRIRLRFDGQLVERFKVSYSEYPALVNQIKIKAGLDISEKRLPQDGRFKIHSKQEEIDIRVSTLPTVYGEKIVLRLLNHDKSLLQLDQLGFNPEFLSDLMSFLNSNSGMLLISGPTGSGKSTSLYSCLNELNSENKNILTVEDPVEYIIDGINQVPIKENIGFGFSEAIRTFLRQDPDIIMIGEIRDHKTAQMAVRAALTGHLVLSTIHANSARGIISRLVEMGIQPFLLESSLKLCMSQRLLRCLCTNCKSEGQIIESKIAESLPYIDKDLKVSKAVGCEKCYYTGYKGRVAIYDICKVEKGMLDNKSQQVEPGNLILNAIELVKNRVTSVEEILPLIVN
jgi:type IV pilus assembly protein PilB